MSESSFDPNARLNRILQDASAEATRQNCRTREAVSDSAEEVKRVLSAHRADAYHHFYKMERDLADLTGLLREQLATKDARIAELESQLKDAQELLFRQHALLASPQAFETLKAGGASSGGSEAAVPVFSPLEPDDGEGELVFTAPVRLSSPTGSAAKEKPRIKLPSFDSSVSSIAQLVMTSADAAHVGRDVSDDERESTAKLDAEEIAAGHAKLEADSKRTALKLPRLRLSGGKR